MTTQTTTTEARNPEWNAYRVILGRPAYYQENYAAKRTADLDNLVAEAKQVTDETPMKERHDLMCELFGFLGSYYMEGYEVYEQFETLKGNDRQEYFENLVGRITGEAWSTVQSDAWLNRYGDHVEGKLVSALECLVFASPPKRNLQELLTDVAALADAGELSKAQISDLEETLRGLIKS